MLYNGYNTIPRGMHMRPSKIEFAAIIFLSLIFAFSGCGDPESDSSSRSGESIEIGTAKVDVDLDNRTMFISPVVTTSVAAELYGNGVQIDISNAGPCSALAPYLVCPIAITDLGDASGLYDVYTRLHDSTNPAATLNGIDFLFDGHTIDSYVPNSIQPINGSGYCHAGMGGITAGCETDDWNIPWLSTNVTTWFIGNLPGGSFTFWVTIYGTPIPD